MRRKCRAMCRQSLPWGRSMGKQVGGRDDESDDRRMQKSLGELYHVDGANGWMHHRDDDSHRIHLIHQSLAANVFTRSICCSKLYLLIHTLKTSFPVIDEFICWLPLIAVYTPCSSAIQMHHPEGLPVPLDSDVRSCWAISHRC